jgi:hypothetical protein
MEFWKMRKISSEKTEDLKNEINSVIFFAVIPFIFQ